MGIENRFSDHHRGMAEGAAQQVFPSDLKIALGHSSCSDNGSLFVDDVIGATDNSIVWIRFEKLNLFFKPIFLRKIIGIHPRDVTTSCQREPFVQGARVADVALVDEKSNAWIFQIAQQLIGAIGGGVIDEDEFKIAEALIKDTGDRSF